MIPRWLAFASALAWTDAAIAGATVFGDTGEGRACYEAAEEGDVTGIEHCNNALFEGQMPPDNVAATHVNRGVLLTLARRYDDAFADMNRALAIKPGLPEAYAGRGNVFFMTKRYERAIEDYTLAIDGKCSRLFGVYYNRGLAHRALKHRAEAIADFTKALELNPGFEDAAAALAPYGLKISALQ